MENNNNNQGGMQPQNGAYQGDMQPQNGAYQGGVQPQNGAYQGTQQSVNNAYVNPQPVGGAPQKKKKKHGCLTAILIVVGVVLFIGILSAIFGGSSEDSDKSGGTKSEATDEKSGDTKSTKEASDEAEESDVPADGKYKVGDTYKDSSVAISFIECGEYTGYDEWSAPTEGKKVVYAKFYIENIGDSDTVVSYWDFDGYCDDVQAEQYYGMDSSGMDFSLDLSAGRSGTGVVAFEIPDSVTDISSLEIEYTASLWSDKKIKFVPEGDGTVVTADNIDTTNSNTVADDSEKYHVGDVYEKDDVRITFTECGEYTEYDDWSKPADGYKVVYAKFDIENVGDSDIYVDYTDFNGFADNQSVNQYYSFDSSKYGESGFGADLSAGRKGSGTVMFEVPNDAAEIDFEFSPSIWSSKHVIFAYSE
jgi:hypothetical protein